MASVTQRGNRWRAQVYKKGHKPLFKSFLYKADADKWATEMERTIERGEFVDMSAARETTLLKALERYQNEITPQKKGKAQETLRIEAWKKAPLASRSLASIRGSDIAEWRDKRLADKKSPTTIRNDLAVLSHLFTVAAKEWGMEGLSNPVQKIKLPAAGRARDRRLDHKPDKEGKTEQDRLLIACEARPPKWFAPLVRLALATAMRQGELLALQWENIDLERKVARLVDSKKGEARDVPLSTAAVAALQATLPPVPEGVTRLPPRGPVFDANTDKIVNEFRAACKAAGIIGLRFHDLRHEATSRLFEIGLNPMEAASVTGHKTLQMLKRYTHLRAEDLAKRLG
jgi:integrase